MALAATLFGAEDLRMVERPLDRLASGMVRVRFGAGGISCIIFATPVPGISS